MSFRNCFGLYDEEEKECMQCPDVDCCKFEKRAMNNLFENRCRYRMLDKKENEYICWMDGQWCQDPNCKNVEYVLNKYK